MILADSCYAKIINAKSFEELLANNYPRFVCLLAKRIGILRGFILFTESLKYSYILTAGGDRGSDTLLLLSAIFNRKNVIVVQFIRKEQYKSFPLFARLTYVPLLFTIRRWTLNRALRAAQVLTHWEINYYKQIYKLESFRLKFIPWYYYNDELKSASQGEQLYDVFVSGRPAMDWPLLFDAAKDQGWRIIIVCSRKDLRQVRKLSRDLDVKVFCEIPLEEHNFYLARSSICLLPLKEQMISVAHIRITHAIAAKVPIVCTNVRGVEGYLTDHSNSLLTETGNAPALREAVNLLLQNDGLKKELVENAFLRAQERPRNIYIQDIKIFVTTVTSSVN